MHQNLKHVYFFTVDEYNDSPEMLSENQYDEIPAKRRSKTLTDETSKTIVEDMNSQTSSLVQNDDSDLDAVKNKGCKYNELLEMSFHQ